MGLVLNVVNSLILSRLEYLVTTIVCLLAPGVSPGVSLAHFKSVERSVVSA